MDHSWTKNLQHRRPCYKEFRPAFFAFAHRALAASEILRFAAADKVRLLRPDFFAST